MVLFFFESLALLVSKAEYSYLNEDRPLIRYSHCRVGNTRMADGGIGITGSECGTVLPVITGSEHTMPPVSIKNDHTMPPTTTGIEHTMPPTNIRIDHTMPPVNTRNDHTVSPGNIKYKNTTLLPNKLRNERTTTSPVNTNDHSTPLPKDTNYSHPMNNPTRKLSSVNTLILRHTQSQQNPHISHQSSTKQYSFRTDDYDGF